MKKLILFGAGKIGRSLIGQLFANSGYEVIFVDISERLIDELNRKKEYSIVIKSNGPDDLISVKNVRGILISNEQEVISEISTCDLLAISVGKNVLPALMPILAKGILLRNIESQNKFLDIIIAENMRNASAFMEMELLKYLPNDYPIHDMLGLIETSIGKMVPIMTQAEVEKDILKVFAEPYNELIVDGKAFKNEIPEVKGLLPKENIKAWVDRKSYIHNLGHVAAAYTGYITDPKLTYIYEVLGISQVKTFTRRTMQQGAHILLKKYPGEFSKSELYNHIEDLLNRFENRSLQDTLYRVGSDLKRKLHRNDRVLSPMLDGLQLNCPVDYIMMVFAFGLQFSARDESGEILRNDQDFIRMREEKGLIYVIEKVLDLHSDHFLNSCRPDQI